MSEPEKVDNGSILRQDKFSSKATCGFSESRTPAMPYGMTHTHRTKTPDIRSEVLRERPFELKRWQTI